MRIFLIEEKIDRQEKYGWTAERLKEKKIECIKDYNAFKEIGFNTICQKENIVFFHDSFFRNQTKEEKYQQDFEQKAQDLYEKALDALAQLSFDTSALKALADFIIHRES